MKNVIFYKMLSPVTNGELSGEEQLTCALATEHWRLGKRILIACVDKTQAERLDEALWQQEPDAFVPHNLAGEGPRYGAPVEICWPEKRGNAARDLLINLMPQFAEFATAFSMVIDFVPLDEAQKEQARERYKIYRNVGFQMKTLDAPIR